MTQFGVQLPNFSGIEPGNLFDHVVDLATTAEGAGFDSVFSRFYRASIGWDGKDPVRSFI